MDNLTLTSICFFQSPSSNRWRISSSRWWNRSYHRLFMTWSKESKRLLSQINSTAQKHIVCTILSNISLTHSFTQNVSSCRCMPIRFNLAVFLVFTARLDLMIVFYRFLADLMDSPELIRNITLCGHLHHGKVRPNLLITVINCY